MSILLISSALAQTATQEAPSVTSISVGTIAGQALDWAMITFGGVLTTVISAVLYKLFQRIGISISDSARAELTEHIVHALNLLAPIAEKQMAGKGQIAVKNKTAELVVNYIESHHDDLAKSVGIDPHTAGGEARIVAQIETAINDPSKPTPAVLGGNNANSITIPTIPSLPSSPVIIMHPSDKTTNLASS